MRARIYRAAVVKRRGAERFLALFAARAVYFVRLWPAERLSGGAANVIYALGAKGLSVLTSELCTLQDVARQSGCYGGGGNLGNGLEEAEARQRQEQPEQQVNQPKEPNERVEKDVRRRRRACL